MSDYHGPDCVLCRVAAGDVQPGTKTPPSVVMGLCVLGHNPVAALYTSHSYYRRLRDKDGQPERTRRDR
jgi:hypothetical protein